MDDSLQCKPQFKIYVLFNVFKYFCIRNYINIFSVESLGVQSSESTKDELQIDCSMEYFKDKKTLSSYKLIIWVRSILYY